MQRKDDMNRIAYMVIKSLPFVPAWFYRVCRLGRDQDPHTEQERYDYLRKLVKRVNKSGRVAIEVHGRDNLPAADGFIMFLLLYIYCTDFCHLPQTYAPCVLSA